MLTAEQVRAWLASDNGVALVDAFVAADRCNPDRSTIVRGGAPPSACDASIQGRPVVVQVSGADPPLIALDAPVLRSWLTRDGQDRWLAVWEPAARPCRSLILGVTRQGHDSSAAVVDARDGSVVAFCQEERISRTKHERRFPKESIRSVLASARVAASDLGAIAVGHCLPWYAAIDDGASPAAIAMSRLPSDFAKRDLTDRNSPSRLRWLLAEALGVDDSSLPLVYWVRHHLAHVFAALTTHRGEHVGVLVADGRGEWDTVTLWSATRDRVEQRDVAVMPNSLGYFYNMFGEFFGWHTYGFEGRLMGLAPYGKPRDAEEEALIATLRAALRQTLVETTRFPFFEVNTDVLGGGYADARIAELSARGWWVSPFALTERGRRLFGALVAPHPPDRDLDPDDVRHRPLCVLAFAVQERLSEVWTRLCVHAAEATGATTLLVAGGVALNALANQQAAAVLASRGVGLGIPPYAADEGLSVGAAAAVSWYLGWEPRTYTATALIGRVVSHAEVDDVVRRYGLVRRSTVLRDDGAAARRVADAIARGDSVAIARGREEAGPRALGARSVLLPAHRLESLSIGNRAKARERWRPLALAVLRRNRDALLRHAWGTSFMNVCVDVRSDRRAAVAAGVHPADDSTRVQLVDEHSAPFLHAVLEILMADGILAVINTSFNWKEPIVATAAEALDTFYYLDGIPHLLLANIWITGRDYAPGLISIERSPLNGAAVRMSPVENLLTDLLSAPVLAHQARFTLSSESVTRQCPAFRELYGERVREGFLDAVGHAGFHIADVDCLPYADLQRQLEAVRR